MSTSSEVKSGLDAVAANIAGNRDKLAACVDTAGQVSVDLANLPTAFADVVATIQAYTPTGAFETLAKDELAKLTAEFAALKADADAIAAVDLSD